jgi:hypothetical protein
MKKSLCSILCEGKRQSKRERKSYRSRAKQRKSYRSRARQRKRQECKQIRKVTEASTSTRNDSQ